MWRVRFVVPYIGTWIETETWSRTANLDAVVPYIGTWIETPGGVAKKLLRHVVPSIGTWIETLNNSRVFIQLPSYLI